jgi:hypothetical protein
MNNNGNKRKTEVNINEMYDDYDMNVDYPDNQNKRYMNMENNNNNTTIVGLNSNQPIGLDLNKFVSNINNLDQTVHNISTSNDLPLISEVKVF